MMHISREANLLGALSIAIGDRIRSTAEREADLDGSSQAAMVAISTFLEGGTIVELSRLSGLSHSATVRLVDRLVEQGLIERDQGADRRVVALRPTRRGRAVGKRILAARERAIGAILGELGGPRREELTPILESLLGALVRRDGDPARICRLCDAGACGHYEGRCPVTETARELSR
jgi:MarR family transcriptional regulator, negative regulator of the multidrug operon emrRAB